MRTIRIISNGKKIEVRSSFPRNGCEFALCNPKYQFDILGPYHNAYKPAEVSKDYFLRTFFAATESQPTENKAAA